MIRSERAGPYASAVSSMVIPSSAARWISDGAVIRRIPLAVTPLAGAELPGPQPDAGEPHPLDLDVAHARESTVDRAVPL